MATDLRSAVRETWEQALDEGRIVSAPSVVDQVVERYPDLVIVEQTRLIRGTLLRWVKDLARVETEQGSQLSLFGFPSVIAIPVDGDDSENEEEVYGYIRTAKAVWPELAAGSQIREVNVRRAQQRLDAYTSALEQVRPFMEGTDRTLADAMGEMA